MAFKKFRKMKVYNVSGYNYKDTPTIQHTFRIHDIAVKEIAKFLEDES